MKCQFCRGKEIANNTKLSENEKALHICWKKEELSLQEKLFEICIYPEVSPTRKEPFLMHQNSIVVEALAHKLYKLIK